MAAFVCYLRPGGLPSPLPEGSSESWVSAGGGREGWKQTAGPEVEKAQQRCTVPPLEGPGTSGEFFRFFLLSPNPYFLEHICTGVAFSILSPLPC